MKTATPKLLMSLLCFFLVVNVSTAQKRYKYHKRVKVETEAIAKPEPVPSFSHHAPFVETVDEIGENILEASPKEKNYSTNAEDLPVMNTQVKQSLAAKKYKEGSKNAAIHADSKAPAPFTGFFQDKIQERNKIREVEKVEKAALARWLTIMIILYAVGLIFLILAAVFSAVGPYAVALVFYIMFALLWIAATIVLILGLTGVM